MSEDETESFSSDSETTTLCIAAEKNSKLKYKTKNTEVEQFSSKQEVVDNSAIKMTSSGTFLPKAIRRIQRLNSELLTAIENGNLELFHRCLREGASRNATCRGIGLTTCHVAVLFDRCYLLEELLSQDADDLIFSFDGFLPLHIAAWKKCKTCLQILIDHNPEKVSTPICAPKDDKQRNLMILDSWDHDHHHLLLNLRMPTINAGSTALHIACRQLNADCIQCLIAKNANAEALDSRCMTPLDVVNETISATHLEGDPSKNSLKSRSSSIQSIRYNHYKTLETCDMENELHEISRIILLLIEHVANHNAIDQRTRTNIVDRKYTTLLHPAVFTQNEKLLKILLSHNIDLTARDEVGDTPLHLAVRHRLKRSLLTLLNSKKVLCTLEMRDHEDKTPLLIAVSQCWNFGASVLLEVGANVNAVTCRGNTVLHFAAATGNESIVDELLTFPEINQVVDVKNSNEETPLMVAVQHDNLFCVRKLIDVGVSLRITTQGYYTVMHVAAEKGYKLILEQLLQKQDSLLREAKTEDGNTALHLAVSSGHVECVQLLLRYGSSTKAKTLNINFCAKTNVSLSSVIKDFDFGGGTVLHCAAAKGNLAVIKCLIEHDRSLVNIGNNKGWRPVHIAAYFNHPDCVAYIILEGGNLSYEVQYVDGRRKSTFDIISYNITDPITFLEDVCDSYLETNDYPLNHPHVCITIKFDMLAPGGEQEKQMKVLKRLLNNKNEQLQRKLFLHPLVKTFLYLKWQKLRTFFIWFTLLLHAMFTFSLTVFALLQQVDKFVTVTTTVFIFIMLATLIPLSLQEILQASKLQRYYFKDLETWVKWTTFGSALYVGMAALTVDSNQWRRLLPIPVLFSWIEILFLLSRFPVWGYYVLMFFRVTSAVVKVFGTFACLFLGFVFSFRVLFDGESPFNSIGETFVKIFVMMFEFDYAGTFSGQQDEKTDFKIVSRFIFLLFVILISTVLMNLMIGLAVSDIATLEAQGKSQTLAKQIDFLSLLETLVYNEKWLSYVPQKLRKKIIANRNIPKTFDIHPGRLSDIKYRHLPTDLKRVIFNKIINRKHVGNQPEILQRLLNISEELKTIKRIISHDVRQ